MVFVPTIIERNASSERVYDLYSCLLKERIIILTGEIDDAMSSSICAQLLYLSSISSEPIIMKYIRCDVSTICMGICASMAAVLLSAGTQGKRSALSNSEIMIHQPMGGMQGQAKDMEIAALHIQKLKERLYSILSENTRQSSETLRRDCDRDYYMDAKEALSYGLIDAII